MKMVMHEGKWIVKVKNPYKFKLYISDQLKITNNTSLYFQPKDICTYILLNLFLEFPLWLCATKTIIRRSRTCYENI